MSHCKRSHHGCFCRPGTQGSAISAFNPLAAQRCVLHRQGFSSSVCQAAAGATLHQRSTSTVGRNGLVGVLNRVYQTMPSLPLNYSNKQNFLLHLFEVGLAWQRIGIYPSAIFAFLEPHLLHYASYHPVIS